MGERMDREERSMRERVRRLTGRESDAELGALERDVKTWKQRREERAAQERAAYEVPGVVEAIQREMSEARPQYPSACRLCGRTTAGPIVHRWRWCSECLPVQQTRSWARAWSLVLGRDITDEAHARALLEALGNPLYGLDKRADDRGQREPFAHISDDMREEAQHVLYRVAWEGTPRKNTLGRGCAWCGVQRSPRWTQSTVRFRDGQPGAMCETCAQRWRSSGQSSHPDDWACHLVAGCTGTSALMGMEVYGLLAYCQTPGPWEGTEQPWQYLGDDRRRLRWAVVRAYPSLATTEEREHLARIAKIKSDAEPPPPPTPLVNLPEQH